MSRSDLNQSLDDYRSNDRRLNYLSSARSNIPHHRARRGNRQVSSRVSQEASHHHGWNNVNYSLERERGHHGNENSSEGYYYRDNTHHPRGTKEPTRERERNVTKMRTDARSSHQRSATTEHGPPSRSGYGTDGRDSHQRSYKNDHPPLKRIHPENQSDGLDAHLIASNKSRNQHTPKDLSKVSTSPNQGKEPAISMSKDSSRVEILTILKKIGCAIDFNSDERELVHALAQSRLENRLLSDNMAVLFKTASEEVARLELLLDDSMNKETAFRDILIKQGISIPSLSNMATNEASNTNKPVNSPKESRSG